MVLFLCEGQKVPHWSEDKQGYSSWILESYWERQGDLQRKIPGWHEEDPCFLQG